MKTTQEKCIIVQKKCGWKKNAIWWGDGMGGSPETEHMVWFHNAVRKDKGPPDYANDLNAIRTAVLAQDEEFQILFARAVYIKANGNDNIFPRIHQLTALDWLDCFVETVENRKAKP